MPKKKYRYWDDEAHFRCYDHLTYTPDIETFIIHWQKADTVEQVAESLQSKLRELSNLDLFVAEAESLLQRAKSWREKGVPLRTLPLSLYIPETEREKIQRLSKLALEHAKED